MSDELNFDFDNKKDEYEDIVSDSGLSKDVSASRRPGAHGKHYRRRNHGLRGFWQRIPVALRVFIVVALSAAVVMTSVAAVFGTRILNLLGRVNQNNITDDPEQLGFESKIDKEVINIALFGIDTRNKNTFKGNSDSIMILSLNTKLKKVTILSVLRDTIVPITDDNGKKTYGKINSAYAKSPETAIRTLNACFDLDISEYATVNFYGMSSIIDAVGGVDIEVTEDELRHKGKDHPNLNECMDEICANLGVSPQTYYIRAAGQYHVNGIQAVAYSRVRNCESIWGTRDDFGRTDRQRHVMHQLFNNALTLDKSKYLDLAEALVPCTETSLSTKQIVGLALNIMLNKPTFYEAKLPETDWLMNFRWSGYGSVLYYDLDFVKKMVHSVIYENDTVENYIENNGVGQNDWFARIGGKPKANSGTATPQKDASGGNGNTEKNENPGDGGETDTGEGGENDTGEGDTPPDSGEGGSTDTPEIPPENPGEDDET